MMAPSRHAHDESDVREDPQIAHVVLLLHGIRDLGGWQERVARQIERSLPGTKCVAVRYGWFSPFAFLAPVSRASAAIDTLKAAYDHALADERQARISIIAHSFGTHVLGECLRKYEVVRPHRLILCGGVLSRHFPWNAVTRRIAAQGTFSVLNECGDTDTWPVVAEICVSRYGASGAYGFLETDGVSTRYRKGGHGLFFDETHVAKSWIPFLARGTVVDSEAVVRAPSTLPRLFLSYPPARWLAYLMTGVAWLVALVLPTWLLFSAIWTSTPAFVQEEVLKATGAQPLVLVRPDGPHGTASGYTRTYDSNPLLKEAVAAINPVVREYQDVLAGPGPVTLNALIQKPWWHHSLAVTAYCLDVVRYEPMPEFVLAPEYGAGQVDSVTVRFELKRLDALLPWRIETTDALLEGGSHSRITRDRPISLTDDHPVQMRYVITAKDPGIYWVRPSLTATRAGGKEWRLFLTHTDVVLAFCDVPQDDDLAGDQIDEAKVTARLRAQVDREIDCITNPRWTRVPNWKPGQQADRTSYLRARQRRLLPEHPSPAADSE